jgi:hypothetical protein
VSILKQLRYASIYLSNSINQFSFYHIQLIPYLFQETLWTIQYLTIHQHSRYINQCLWYNHRWSHKYFTSTCLNTSGCIQCKPRRVDGIATFLTFYQYTKSIPCFNQLTSFHTTNYETLSKVDNPIPTTPSHIGTTLKKVNESSSPSSVVVPHNHQTGAVCWILFWLLLAHWFKFNMTDSYLSKDISLLQSEQVRQTTRPPRVRTIVPGSVRALQEIGEQDYL